MTPTKEGEARGKGGYKEVEQTMKTSAEEYGLAASLVALGAEELAAQRLWEDVVEAYETPPRAYHNLGHARAVAHGVASTAKMLRLDLFEQDYHCAIVAAWLHDVVHRHEAGVNDAQESAKWWLDWLGSADVAGDKEGHAYKIAHGILATDGHRSTSLTGALVIAGDMGCLAGPWKQYAHYMAAIRREWAHVPWEQFRKGRAAIMARYAERAEAGTLVRVDGDTYDRRVNARIAENVGREIANVLCREDEPKWHELKDAAPGGVKP